MNIKRYIRNEKRKLYLLKKILRHSINCKKIDYIKTYKSTLNSIRNNNVEIKKLLLDSNIKYDCSIIVPIFNVEKYVNDCIESLLNQKTQYSYEIILVNDGSTDESLKVIEQYEDKKNIKIINQKNKGLGAARNVGCCNSNGQYIIFVDSDDVSTSNCVEDLVSAIKNNNYDVVIAEHSYYGKKIKNRQCKTKEIKKNKQDYLRGVAWARIYKRELFYNFSMFENCWYEDASNALILPYFANKVGYLNKIVYLYRKREMSIMQETNKSNNYKQIDAVYIVDKFYDYIMQNKLSINNENYSTIIDQLTAALAPRIKNQSELIKKNIFMYAYDILRKFKNLLSEKDYKKLNFYDKNMEKIILTLDYENWK